MRRDHRHSGFTLIELMVTVAIMLVLIVLVAPSFQDMIVMQRLRGTSAQLNTDLQYARAEAVARGRYVRVHFGGDADQTCYVLFLADSSSADRCECTRGAGSACSSGDGRLELKTVSIPTSGHVQLSWPTWSPLADPSYPNPGFAFDFVTGGLLSTPSDTPMGPSPEISIDVSIDAERLLRHTVLITGRPAVCSPNPARMQVPTC